MRLVVNSLLLPEMLGVPVGRKTSNGFSIPEWVFENPTGVRMLVKGLIETDGSVARVFRRGAWYSHVHFVASNPVIMAVFLRAVEILGYPFRCNGNRAILSNTAMTKHLVAELDITKCKEYVYS